MSTRTSDERNAHIASFDLLNLHEGDVLKINVEVLEGGPLSEVVLLKWTCVTTADGRQTNCGWPGFIKGSAYVDGDPHQYNVGRTSFSRDIHTEWGSTARMLYLIGPTDDTKVRVVIAAGKQLIRSAAPSAQQIADAKAKGLVWVNANSGVYHKAGKYYGMTANGRFMAEEDARKAGYKPAQH